MRYAVMLFLMLVSVGPCFGQWYDPTTGAPYPEDESRKTQGEFGAMLAIAANPDSFLSEWFSTEHSHIPHLTEADRVKRGDNIAAVLFYSGCAPKGHQCEALVDFTVLQPDGTVYGEAHGYKLSSQIAPGKATVLLSEANMMIRIEETDPVGVYPVEVVIHQKGSEALVLERRFEVVE